MDDKIQTQKYGFLENFEPKNIRILHISYPEIWVKIAFCERWFGNRQSRRTSVLSSIITLDLAKIDFALSLLLAKTMLKEAGVIQIWFSHCALNG